ncbi:MAG TPA: 5-methyltetrahydropteroyltriglutamate--homocysteine S-methyltransferase [Solirubrobacterales bacterium]|nr:5-methyltetrahydropteroyltriglutamate--homocysteine S-methyltransferase [Solirubrobacterales bacterium]
MALSNVSGFPRIGRNRELKFATEGYWRGETSADELAAVAKAIRVENWKLMQGAGIDLVPSNDFSYYDQVLDTIALVGAVPERYGWDRGQVDLDTYFAMARGRQTDDLDVTAMEMTKWFDTNYHYLVPELGPETRFSLSSTKPFDEHAEAMEEVGIDTVPVLIGPVSFLLLSKPAEGVSDRFDAVDLVEPLVEVYGEVIEKLAEQGATWVQLDEPCFVEDRSERELDALRLAYEELCKVHERPRILVKTYFDHVGDAYGVLRDLPIEGVGLDFTGNVHGDELDPSVHEHGGRHNAEFIASQEGLDDQWLFAGIVDGRNVWINHLEHSLDALEGLRTRTAQLVVSTSCSLLHTPIDLDAEPAGADADLDEEMRSWMAFAVQKVGEVATLATGLADGREAIADRLDANDRARDSRRDSERTRNAEVRARIEGLDEEHDRRSSSFEERRPAQRARIDIPELFPSTTIGSFPQTDEIRQTRAKEKRGEIDWQTYKQAMEAEIEKVIRFQEDVGLDVLVHGEPERNDMVQYFGEQMEGYVFTENAWVQSYGSRCVRPPIIFGDVLRPSQMTVDWITYAQSLTDKPVKGMLTGPVTMLEWSFVRDDQPLADTCKQLALAIRDEVEDLETAGVQIIQVDEPAIREGLPLRKDRWGEYLSWAVHCFRLATAVVKDETQIQTHMCYSDFGDILEQIQEMDADVTLIEAARSRMELLHDWERTGYRNDIGPGVYDIHSPRIPSADEMVELLHEAARVLRPGQLWVNPDCGLKTRAWDEVDPSLRNMVDAAKQLREELVPAS